MGSCTTRLRSWFSGTAETHATMNTHSRKQSSAVPDKTKASSSVRTPGSPIFQDICQGGFKVNLWSPVGVISDKCRVASEFWEIRGPE